MKKLAVMLNTLSSLNIEMIIIITIDLLQSVGHSPVFKILLKTVVKMSIMASPPALTNSAGMLSTSTDFPIFSI